MNSSTDIEYLCRLCGSKTITQNRRNIFDSVCIKQNIRDKISNCLDIHIKSSDSLPKVICVECVNNIENFNQFKIKSHKTNITLQSLFCEQFNIPRDTKDRDNVITNHTNIINEDTNSNQCSVEYISNSLPKSEMIISVDPNNVLSTSSESLNNPFGSWENNDIPIIQQRETNTQKCNKKRKKSSHDTNIPKNQLKNKKLTKCIKNDKLLKSEPIKTYYCELCPKIWHNKTRLCRHIALHLRVKKFACTYCEKKFKTTSELKKHVQTHEKAYTLVCNYCGQGFYSNTCLDNHLRSKHTKDFQYPCKICGKKFLNKSRLRDHNSFMHDNIYAFKCDMCDKSFKTKECLKKHKKSHIPVEERKKYTCNVCGIAVVRRSTLKSHMIVHTGETPFDCKICEKSYNTSNGLKIHMLTHTKEKSYVCNVCGKAFALRHHLRVHDLTHTGERPYTCNFCNKSFTQSSSLNLHRKKSCPGQKTMVNCLKKS